MVYFGSPLSQVQSSEISQFLRDAHAFVTSSREAIERSAPHIYISTLPFAAKYSLIYKYFAHLCTGIISAETFGIDYHRSRLVMTLSGHQGSVNSIVYSPDGLLLASGSSDGTVRIWDAHHRDEAIAPLRSSDGDVLSVAFAPDSRSVASGTEIGVVHIWSLIHDQSVSQRLLGHSGPVWSVVFSPIGCILASASDDQTICLWRAETGEQISVLSGHTGSVLSIAFSPDGTILASGSSDKTIRLWQADIGESSGEPLRGYTEAVRTVAFSPDGKKVASGSYDGSIWLWEIETRKCITKLKKYVPAPILSVQFSPDGQSVIAGQRSLFPGINSKVLLWNLRDDAGTERSTIVGRLGAAFNSVAFSTDGAYVASASSDSNIRIWDVGGNMLTPHPLHGHDDSVNSVAISSDGNFIVSGSGDHSVRIWNAQTGEPSISPLLGHTNSVETVALSSDGCLIVSASSDAVRLWDGQTGELKTRHLHHQRSIKVVAFSTDMQWIASGDYTKVCVWDMATGQPTSIGPFACEKWVSSVAFSPDGQLLIVGDSETYHDSHPGGQMYFWKMENGRQARKPINFGSGDLQCISFSPASTHIVIGGRWIMGINIWNIRTGKKARQFKGHTMRTWSVVYSPDGRLIASGSDSHVCLWDAATGSLTSTLHGHHGYVRSIAFTPDGQSIVSGAYDGTIRIWDLATVSSPSSNDLITSLVSTSLEDGWVLGPSGELLLWVPADYRAYLQIPGRTLVIGKHRVIINASGDLHRGENWTKCWRRVATSTVAQSM